MRRHSPAAAISRDMTWGRISIRKVFRPFRGYSGNIYLSPDSNIEYKECPEHGQIELYGNQGNDDVNNPDAAVTFLGNTSGFTFRFGGSDL